MYSQNQSDFDTAFKSLSGMKIKLINEPENFTARFINIFHNVELIHTLHQPIDSIFLFVQSKGELIVELPVLSRFVKCDGNLIISIPSRNSNNITDLNEGTLNELVGESSMKFSEKVYLDRTWDSFVYIHNGKEP